MPDQRRIALLVKLEWASYTLMISLPECIPNSGSIIALCPLDSCNGDVYRIERLSMNIVRGLVVGFLHEIDEGPSGR